MPMMPYESYFTNVVSPVLKGEADEFLDGILQTIQMRKDQLKPKIYEYRVGQRVKFSGTIRPKYLAGALGTVQKVNRTKIVVDLDERHERFYRNISTPLSMVEMV